MSDKTHKIQIDIWNKYKNETKESLLEIISNQDKEIERLNKIIEINYNRIQQLMSRTRSARINKAIEYINKNGIIDLNGYDLLEILQGSDKE